MVRIILVDLPNLLTPKTTTRFVILFEITKNQTEDNYTKEHGEHEYTAGRRAAGGGELNIPVDQQVLNWGTQASTERTD